MAALRITADAKTAITALLGLQDRLRNLRPALSQIRDLALASIRQNFTVGGRPQRWAPLKNYRAEGRGGRGKILIRTGALQSSIEGRTGLNTVVLETTLGYAAIHQFGGTVQIPEVRARRGRVLSWLDRSGQRRFATRVRSHSVHIPARPYMVLHKSDEDTFSAVLTQYLLRGIE